MKLLLSLLILCFLQNCSKDNMVVFSKISEIKTYKLETPPIITWEKKFERTYQGTIYRNEQNVGLSFAFTKNYSQGHFYYKLNNEIEKGHIILTGTNQEGYWFRWNDKFAKGSLQLREYTDGSLRGIIYIDDGTMLGKRLGEFKGFKQ